MDNVLLVALAIAVIGLGLIAAALAGRDRRDHRTTRQLAALERKLDVLIEHLGIDVTEPRHPEVERLLDAGKKVAAIKAYRKATGADLLEAKNAVERRERGRQEAPTEPAPVDRPATSVPDAVAPEPAVVGDSRAQAKPAE